MEKSKLPEWGAVPIVAMTANAMNEDRQQCLAAGMDHYVTKPIDQRRLFDALEGVEVPLPAVRRIERAGHGEDAVADRFGFETTKSALRYMQAAERYMAALAKVVLPSLVTRGGPILMVQVENEYGSYSNDRAYMERLRTVWKANGIDVPFFTGDGPTPYMLEAGSLPVSPQWVWVDDMLQAILETTEPLVRVTHSNPPTAAAAASAIRMTKCARLRDWAPLPVGLGRRGERGVPSVPLWRPPVQRPHVESYRLLPYRLCRVVYYGQYLPAAGQPQK